MTDLPTRQDITLYKKYFKAANNEGFLTIKPWFDVNKLSVDIGAVNNGTLQNNTLAWVNAIDLAVYLRAIVNQTAEELYPAKEREGINTPESFIAYGGGTTGEGHLVARVVKIHRWAADSKTAFAWKAGAFEGRKTKVGAIIPDMTKPITQNMIRISRLEMHEISYRLDLGLMGHLSRVGNEFWDTQKRD